MIVEQYSGLLDLYQKEKAQSKKDHDENIELLSRNSEIAIKNGELQKELEKEKEKRECALLEKEELLRTSISKDKIKAKIEKVNNDCKKCRFKGEICKELCKNNQCTQGTMKQVLQELLEEE